jgi:hypothetical protein
LAGRDAWSSQVLALHDAVIEYQKDFRSSITLRSTGLYLVKEEGHMPADWSLEFVFADRVSSSGTLIEGRILNLDNEKRVIYSLPFTKKSFADALTQKRMVPLIGNIGLSMTRAPAEYRQPMAQWALLIRSVFCTLLDNAATCIASTRTLEVVCHAWCFAVLPPPIRQIRRTKPCRSVQIGTVMGPRGPCRVPVFLRSALHGKCKRLAHCISD